MRKEVLKIWRLARVLSIYFSTRTHISGESVGMRASLTPTLTVLCMRLMFSSLLTICGELTSRYLITTWPASRSFLLSWIRPGSTFICNDAHVRRSSLQHPRYTFCSRSRYRVNVTSRPFEEFYPQFSPRYENITLAY